jgi:hypothetical protein
MIFLMETNCVFCEVQVEYLHVIYIVSRRNRVWHSVPSADNTQTGSTPYLHLLGTYEVAYEQFHQDPLRSMKMVLLQRRNM